MKKIFVLFFLFFFAFLFISPRQNASYAADLCTTTLTTECDCYVCPDPNQVWHDTGPDDLHTQPGCYQQMPDESYRGLARSQMFAVSPACGGTTVCVQGKGCQPNGISSACTSTDCTTPACTGIQTCSGTKPPVSNCHCIIIPPSFSSAPVTCTNCNCEHCPGTSQYYTSSDPHYPTGCYDPNTLATIPVNADPTLSNASGCSGTCTQGSGVCVGGGENPGGGGSNPVNCPSGNCNGVSFPIPALNALGLTMVPSGGSSKLGNIISVTISLLVLTAIILCLLYLLWGGFYWITSEGDKTKLESARQRVIYAIIGLVIVFCAFLVINLLFQFFFQHRAIGIGG